MDDLRPHVRLEPPPGDDVLLLRGGEDTVPKLRRHAERTHRAFTLDGSPVYGLSVFCALDELAQRQRYRRLAAYPPLRASSVARVRGAGFRLLPTFTRPHFTVVLASVERESSRGSLPASILPPTFQGMDIDGDGCERRSTMVTVDIPADLHDEDETGYVWTFLDEARQPSLIQPGTIVLAGDDDAPAVAEVVDLIPKEAGTIVHLRILPGLFDDYEALVRRARSLEGGTPGSPRA